MEASDRTLLDRYLAGSDEAAFGVLVRRYLDLVHAVALRVTGNEELARDVTQLTFVRLAQRAALIPEHVTLTAWLHRVTRGLAVDQVRAESRRKKRELSSNLLHSPMDASDLEPDWSALAPVVDELIDRLPAADRELLLLRYYRNQSHAVIAARLGLTEGVARKRAFRAVEKLRVLLGKRGIATSAAALATLLPAHASPAAPALLATSVIQAAQGITPIVPHFLNSILLTVTTSQKAALAGTFLLLIAGTGYTFSSNPAAGVTASPPESALTRPTRGENPAVDRTRRVRAAPGTPEERFARLQKIMAIDNRAGRHAELIDYLDGLSPDLFEETARDVVILTPDHDQGAILLALSAWTRLDPPAALAFTFAQPWGSAGADHEKAILMDWGTLDPQAAIKWAEAKRPDDRPGGVNAVLLGVARNSPADVPGLIDRIGDSDLREAAIYDLVRELKDDPGKVDRIMASSSESQRAVFLGGQADQTKDWLKGAAILNEHPEAVAFSSPRGIYRQWVYNDFSAATSAVAVMPPGALKEGAAEGLIEGAVYRDIGKTLELMELYPDAVKDSLRLHLIREIGKTEPALAMEQIPMLSDESQRTTIVVGQLKGWMTRDPAAARDWIEAHPQPPAVLEQLQP